MSFEREKEERGLKSSRIERRRRRRRRGKKQLGGARCEEGITQIWKYAHCQKQRMCSLKATKKEEMGGIRTQTEEDDERKEYVENSHKRHRGNDSRKRFMSTRN